ncbi:MAG: cache domain-containing protein [Thioalkalispiraceae bacterium]
MRASLQTVLITTQEALHIWIDQRKFDIDDITENSEILRSTSILLNHKIDTRHSQSLETIRSIMAPRLSRYGDRDFLIISPDRKNLASMIDTKIGRTSFIHKQRKAYLDSAFKGATVFIPTIYSDTVRTKFGLSDNTTVPAIFIAAPIKNLSGKIIAVLALKINLKRHFTRITQLSRIGETGETYAFDDKGILISESRFDNQLRRIGLIGSDSRGILSIRIVDPGGNLLEGYTPDTERDALPLTLMASKATKGISGYDTNGYRDYRGVEVFGAWLWDRELGFGLATEVDAAEAMQPYYTTCMAIIVIAGLSLMLSCILITVLFKSKN